MSTLRTPNGDLLESGCELIDVTSHHRPDPSWQVTDQAGHVHQWYADAKPATGYSPMQQYTLPTLSWVIDGTYMDEDGFEHTIGHHECRECGEHVEPRSTADTHTQMIPGLRWFKINGEPVSPEAFNVALYALRSD